VSRTFFPEGWADRIFTNIDAVVKHVSAITGDDNQRQIKDILERTNTLSLNLLKLSADFDRTRNRLDKLFTDSHDIVTKNREDIRVVVVELRNSLETISQNISVISYNLEMASRNMNEFSRQIRNNPGILIGGTPPKDMAKPDL
jgi:phospholipid/cholesterol/gamma-HCH transport system substrate-binding protein